VKVTVISDLHGDRPKLGGGDLLIVAGDLTARDTLPEYHDFNNWLGKQNYKKKIVIAGNHDNMLKTRLPPNDEFSKKLLCWGEYLCDSGTEFEGLKIWGTPWTRWFEGVNPDCIAFMLLTEFQLRDKFDLIPEDTDILISHGPCFQRLDKTLYGDHAGSTALRDRVDFLRGKKLKYHFHGHIHEAYGKLEEGGLITMNVSRMDRSYRPVNSIVKIEI
jgi:Icc-related predicted phosphoesterase